MHDVDFISSLGIRMLITAGKLLARRKVDVRLVSPASDGVKEALDVAELTDLFRFFDSAGSSRFRILRKGVSAVCDALPLPAG